MAIKMASKDNFNELKSGEFVLVDFFATWCGPCKMLAPVLEELENDRSGVEIVKVDIDECSDIAREYGVMSVPTLFLMKKGEIVSKQNGYMPKEMLTNWINENK